MTASLPSDALRTGTDEEAARLRAALSAAGLVSEDAERPTGDGRPAPGGHGDPFPAVDAGGAGAGETLWRLWQLGEAVAEDEAGAALGLPATRLVELGLVRPVGDGTVVAEVVVTRHEGMWFACDSTAVRPGPVAPNLVMPVSGSSLLLAGCLPSANLGTVLDVGTGSGIQAVVASRRADAVVATDVNPRAVSVARFNAWLNSAPNVEVRCGSLMEPVGGERFDLVVANPPFVVSPDSVQLYRDSPGGADELCRSLVEQAGAVLAPAGMGVFLVNWARREDEDPFAAPRSWVEGSGLNALVLHHFSEDGEKYARRWLGNGGTDPDPAEVARWTGHYRSLGVHSIATGLVVLHRPRAAGAAPGFSALAAPVTRAATRKGDHLRQLVALQEFLREIASEERGPLPLLSRVLRPAEDHELQRTYRWRGGAHRANGARARIGTGFPFSVALDAGSAELLSRCDGCRRLGDVTAALAAEVGADTDEVSARALPSVRQLVAMGFLLPPEVPDLPCAAVPVEAPVATA